MDDTALLRYSRQIMLPDFDVEGQQRLIDGSALIVGMGGLGSPAALYLAAAGVGRLVIADHDAVDLSNLQRQIAHREASIGQPKVASAAETIAAINPHTVVHRIEARLDAAAMADAVAGVNVVLDATDNFDTRQALNDACWQAGVPLVSGAAIRWEGQLAVFDPRREDSPCYRCLYDDGEGAALNCAENGVIAPLVGIIGTCQALEAIKLLAGVGDALVGSVLYFDGKRMEWRRFRLKRRANCATCGG